MGVVEYFVYSHVADLDGIASAAIMKRFFDHAGVNGHIDFSDYSPATETRTLDEISSMRSGSVVVIADIGLDKRIVAQAVTAAQKLSENGGKLIWLDHHEWDKDVKASMEKLADLTVAEGKMYCGAQLTCMRFMKDDMASAALATLGRDSDIDMWDRKPPKAAYALTQPLSELINYYNHISGWDHKKKRELLMELVDQLAKLPASELLRTENGEELLTQKNREDLAEYRRLMAAAMPAVIQNAKRFTVNGYDVVVSISRGIVNGTVAASRLSEELKPDIVMVIFPSGSTSIRRRDESVKCDEIAKQLGGGGGHDYAAGTHLPMKAYSEDEYIAAVDYIRNRLGKILPQKVAQKNKA